MRAFVTGLDGFVGQWLARELVGAGADVRGGSRVDRPSYSILSRKESRALGWSAFELTDRASIERAVAAARPDAVYHLAAQASVAESLRDPVATYEANVIGTALLLEAVAAKAPKASVVCVGSADSYGTVSASDLPLRESAPLHPNNPYAASKAAAESIALQYARTGRLRVMTTRSFNHTGPGQRTVFAVPAFAQQIADIAAGTLPPTLRVGNLDARRDVTDVRDVVRAYRLIAERGETGAVYNIASGRSVSMRSIVDDLIRIAGVDVKIEVDPDRLRPSDMPDLVGDFSRVRERTGWSPAIPLDQTLRDVYAFHARRDKGTTGR
jgi:GDP-4-dehydro-6-deoxy-D-mannose reductase